MFMKYSSQEALALAIARLYARFLSPARAYGAILRAMPILGRPLCLLVAISLATAPVYAQKGKPAAPSGLQAPADVDTAEQLYAKLDYEGAKAVAERVLKSWPPK
jgi:hypothetical protein